MSGWKAKRFWVAADVVAEGAGWAIRLDGRAVRTPAKAPLIVPTRAMAQAIAAEWDAQHGEVRPDTMPVTRAANSAIDKVSVQFDEVAGLIAAYGASDLLCYRAEGPAALIARQAAAWDPLLDWASEALAAPLVVTCGVVPVGQPATSLARLDQAVRGFDPFELTALHDLVALTGSLVIGLALAQGRVSVAEGWDASRIDESWQAEHWGHDEDAAAIVALKRQGLGDAARFLGLCRAGQDPAQ
jgi:chaperone required for assembly of F1-ATPase